MVATALALMAALTFGSTSVVASGGSFTQAGLTLPLAGPSIDLAMDGEFGRVGARLTVVGGYHPWIGRWKPLVAGELIGFGQLRLLQVGALSTQVGAAFGIAASVFCGGDMCFPLALRPGLEIELGYDLTPGLSAIVRGHGGATLSLFSFGWMALAGAGLRF